jgi:hypothetical protein
MSTEVGERAEPAPARWLPLGPDCLRLGVLFAVAVAVHGWLVAHTAVPARDSLAYARIANNLRDPNAGAEPGRPRSRVDVIRTAEHPPGFPLAVCAVEAVLRRASDLPLPDRMLLATQLANSAAAVLLVVPLYLTGRMLFGRDVGFAAALLFQVLPVPARVTGDGLSEGLYLLAAAGAVCLAVWAARRPGVVGYFLCGAAAGASYLVRPEGILVAVGVGAVVGWGGLTRRGDRGVVIGRLTALLAGVSLVAAPYVVLIGKLTNKPTGSYLANPLDDRPAKIWSENPGARAPGAESVAAPFAVWRNPLGEPGTSRETWALRAVGAELVKSTHYVVGALAVFGLIARRRRLSDPGLGTLVVLGLLSLGLMIYLAARIGYVSERHTLLFVMLACVLAAAALEPFARAAGLLPVLGRAIIWPAAAPGGFLVVLVASALPFTLKPMHAQREGHKHAGRWLAAHAREGDWVKDPLGWGEWYAGRALYTIPAPGERAGSVWVIVERGKKGPHSLLPLWEESNTLAAGRTPVYRWPEGGPQPGPAVEVYRLELADLRAPRVGGPKPGSP